MDLKEYLSIIKKKREIFLWVVLITIFTVGIYFYFKTPYYDTSLTINITRLGNQNTQNYQYDDFYRLQADEKFAETLVRWVTNPRIVKDTYSGAGIETANFSLTKLAQSFSAQKQSSQVVVVHFVAPNKSTAEKIATSLSKNITYSTQELNIKQQEKNWFYLIFKKPVIVKHIFNYKLIFLITLAVGIFLGFWAVMIKYYFE